MTSGEIIEKERNYIEHRADNGRDNENAAYADEIVMVIENIIDIRAVISERQSDAAVESRALVYCRKNGTRGERYDAAYKPDRGEHSVYSLARFILLIVSYIRLDARVEKMTKRGYELVDEDAYEQHPYYSRVARSADYREHQRDEADIEKDLLRRVSSFCRIF